MASPHDLMPLMTPEHDEEAGLLAFKLSSSSALIMAVRAAVDLGLIDILLQAAAAPTGAKLSSADVVSQLPTSNPEAAGVVDRILSLLAVNGIVSCTVDDDAAAGRQLRRYGAAPVCKYLQVKSEDGGSLGPLCIIVNDKVCMESWYYIKDAVLGGVPPFHKAHGKNIYDYMGADSQYNKGMNDGMKGLTILLIRKLTEIYQGFNDVNILVDVGGGIGAAIGVITSKFHHIKGINFDLPHVISQASPLPGVEHISGDMFESIPNGDVILLKYVLPNWSDEHCAKILSNCWRALENKGKVIIFDHILPEVPEPTLRNQLIFQIDLQMLAYTPGGKQRTRNQFQVLAKEAGFSRFNVTYIFGGVSLIELKK